VRAGEDRGQILPARPRTPTRAVERPRVRVAIDAHSIGRNATGGESYIAGLLHGLSATSDVEPIALFEGAGVVFGDGVRRGDLRWRNPVGRLLDDLRAVGRRWGADLLHTQFLRPPRSDVPCVTTIHDLSFERFPGFFSPRMALRMRLSVPWSARHSAAVITGSQHARNEIMELYGLPGDRVHVTPYAADESFRPMSAESCATVLAGIGLQPGFLLCVGNLQPRKNLERVIEAFAALPPSVRPRLVIAGPQGWRSSRVFESVRRHGLHGEVQFAGHVSSEQLVALYNGAAAFAYPSLYEGFGLPVLEAMACGTPTLTSNVASLPEVAGDAAVLVDPRDVDSIRTGLEQVLLDTELRGRLRDAGHLQAARFSWGRCGRDTAAVYRSVLDVAALS
jgi:glycosyltransferase involved in cell wall biosynthesis